MKKLVCIVVSLLFLTFSLTGCNILGGDLKALPYSFFASTEKITIDTLKKVVKAFDNRDKEMVKSLFAKNILKKYKNFDKELDKAFKYYTIKSEKVEYSWSGDSDSTEDGITITFTGGDVTIKKANKSFDISIEICSNDDNDDLNVGVWNLYIVDNNLDENEIKGIYSDDDIGSDIPKYGIYVGW